MGTKRMPLVIDMLHDFIDPSGSLYVGQTSRRIIDPIARKIKEFHAVGDLVLCYTTYDRCGGACALLARGRGSAARATACASLTASGRTAPTYHPSCNKVLVDRRYKVTLYKDTVADFDGEAHEFSLKRMAKTFGAQVL